MQDPRDPYFLSLDAIKDQKRPENALSEAITDQRAARKGELGQFLTRATQGKDTRGGRLWFDRQIPFTNGLKIGNGLLGEDDPHRR
jgi:hypothetical protein